MGSAQSNVPYEDQPSSTVEAAKETLPGQVEALRCTFDKVFKDGAVKPIVTPDVL